MQKNTCGSALYCTPQPQKYFCKPWLLQVPEKPPVSSPLPCPGNEEWLQSLGLPAPVKWEMLRARLTHPFFLLLKCFLPPSILKSGQVGTWMSRQGNSSPRSEVLSLVNKPRLLSYELSVWFCCCCWFFPLSFWWLKLPSQTSLATSVGVEAKTFQPALFLTQQEKGKTALQCLNLSWVALVAMPESSQFQPLVRSILLLEPSALKQQSH